MGILQQVASHPLAHQFQAFGLPAQIGIALGGLVLLSIILNVANQILFKNPNEPPMVFHWLPFIGSTVTYGMDPPRFFHENRAKVRLIPILINCCSPVSFRSAQR
jgi:sterol 14-demethylase